MRAFVVLAVAALAAASTGSRVTLFKRSAVPKDWTVGARASSEETLRFAVALKYAARTAPDTPLWPLFRAFLR